MKEPNSTHSMGAWYIDIRSPAGTPRFYIVRECKLCGAEEIKHPAGHFVDEELLCVCPDFKALKGE